ncbi:hypothetical protein EV194_1052 [Natronoflexus pectinivorans]|uniref:Uncharacterized protein n=1 Tax=Natronoflexus pectinivorans TaxID=682526 RepID=A0A4R2GI33_9BACT|nr:hypothetical protein EV194_1052 [Natronoflexus pectinivorans]
MNQSKETCFKVLKESKHRVLTLDLTNIRKMELNLYMYKQHYFPVKKQISNNNRSLDY